MVQWRAAIGLACTSAAMLPLRQAEAWMHGGSWSGDRSSWSYSGMRGTASGGDGSWSAHGYRGGSASGGGGSWSGTSYRGGTASGGDGSWHAAGAYGGTASGGGGTWHATGAYGNTAYGGYDHYGGSYYYGYHPPTVVNSYSAGCYNCGGWNTGAAVAAGVTGLAAGATIGAASAASASAYAAAALPAYVTNDIYPTLPAGCVYSPVAGSAYYQCSGTWFSPNYGANGTYYRVVPMP
jgi:hypothetical protein